MICCCYCCFFGEVRIKRDGIRHRRIGGYSNSEGQLRRKGQWDVQSRQSYRTVEMEVRVGFRWGKRERGGDDNRNVSNDVTGEGTRVETPSKVYHETYVIFFLSGKMCTRVRVRSVPRTTYPFPTQSWRCVDETGRGNTPEVGQFWVGRQKERRDERGILSHRWSSVSLENFYI